MVQKTGIQENQVSGSLGVRSLERSISRARARRVRTRGGRRKATALVGNRGRSAVRRSVAEMSS